MKELIYFLLGFIIFSLSAGDKTGSPNKFDLWLSKLVGKNISTSLIFEYENYIIHIHHWIIMLIIGFFVSTELKYLCLGSMFQSFIFYDDSFIIWKKKFICFF